MSVWPVYLTTGEDRPAESSSLAAIDPPGRKGSPEPGILILRLVPSRPRSVANAVRLSSPLHWNPTQSVWLPIKQSDSLAAVMVGLATDPGEITTERNRLGVRSLSGVGGLVEDIVSGKNHIEEPGLVARICPRDWALRWIAFMTDSPPPLRIDKAGHATLPLWRPLKPTDEERVLFTYR